MILQHKIEKCVKIVPYVDTLKVNAQHTVGSSRSSRSGSINKALASAILIRQPPEKALVGFFCISGVKLRPLRVSKGEQNVTHELRRIKYHNSCIVKIRKCGNESLIPKHKF